MKNGSYNVETIELSKSRRKLFKKRKIKSFKNIKNLRKKYDLIYSDQTFEHLSEPGIVIKRLSKLIKKNGYLFFKIPSGTFVEKKLKKIILHKKMRSYPLNI